MAENKYDLITVPTSQNERPKHHPWYKERVLRSQNWNKGVQTTRRFPSSAAGWCFLGTLDTTDGNAEYGKFHEKKLAQKSASKRRVGNSEHDLPLESYLKQSGLAPDKEKELCNLLGKVDISQQGLVGLETEDNIQKEKDRHRERSQNQTVSSLQNPNILLPPEETGQSGGTVPNPYKMYMKKTHSSSVHASEIEVRSKKKQVRRPEDSLTARADQYVNQVTHDFCQWLNSLPGEDPQLDEDTLKSLFDTGFDQNTALSVQVKVTELTHFGDKLNTSDSAEALLHGTLLKELEEGKKQEISKRKKTHCDYGAWYLPPDTWERHFKGEPLVGPGIKDETSGQNDNEQQEISELHCTKAFLEFFERNNNYKKPKFLA